LYLAIAKAEALDSIISDNLCFSTYKDWLELFVVFGIIRDYVKIKGLPINFTLTPIRRRASRKAFPTGGWEREKFKGPKNIFIVRVAP